MKIPIRIQLGFAEAGALHDPTTIQVKQSFWSFVILPVVS